MAVLQKLKRLCQSTQGKSKCYNIITGFSCFSIQLQLGNSTLNPTIAQLVLNQLCPAIRNILQDGLRSYKLDLIVGQRRNQPWDIVLASTQPGQ